MGPAGPYHHSIPPHPMSHHIPYQEQMPTTSHPSWHHIPPHSAHESLPTPPYPPHPAHQMHPSAATSSYPPMPPSLQDIQQRPPSYSSPSPSRGPSAPPQNHQKFRTEQWINDQSWPYAQSPAPPVCPSVMSYQQGQNDDRMSMLSVNTQMTNQYPDAQRCYSSNGSTCENVNPEQMQMSVAQAAEMAMRKWFSFVTPDPVQRLQMARAIRTWIKQEKFSNVNQDLLPEYIQQILDIVHDGMKPLPARLSQEYYSELYYILLDTLYRITCISTTTPSINLVIKMFAPRDNTPNDLRELFCTVLHNGLVIRMDVKFEKHWKHWKHCTNSVFQLIKHIITETKNEKLRAEFAQSLKFPRLVYTLWSYFQPPVPVDFVHPHIFKILRFLISKDAGLKNSFIWQNVGDHKGVPPPNSLIIMLNALMLRVHGTLAQPQVGQNQELCQHLILNVLGTFELLGLLLHDSDAIDGFVKVDGVTAICTILQIPNPEVARAAFKLLLDVSDARALANIQLAQVLPYLMNFIHNSQDDYVIYSGTGFLSNVVAHKQHVKELAIGNNAIMLLHTIISRQPRISDVPDAPKRNRNCEIISNSLRTLNNFLVMWIATTQMRETGEKERQQVCKFLEPEILKKLLNCLSAEGVDTPALMELRSTILRFFNLLLRTPFIPKQALLNVIDDVRNENLVGHICAAYSWVGRQSVTPRTVSTKQQLMERAMSVLIMLMEQCGAEKQVAHLSYSMECPLNLLGGDQVNPTFARNVLVVCDKILEHCPERADIWTIDRPMLEGLTNHRNAEIAKAANSLLSRFPDNDLLAGLLSNRFF
uniref:Uncharacterized protein n=1 Tax=Caenorhabditis japonica TaxID=281687 RepID=A0A8R1DEW6_CAEJA